MKVKTYLKQRKLYCFIENSVSEEENFKNLQTYPKFRVD